MDIKFEQEYILENEKVLLRPLELNDLKHLQHFAAQEPEIWTYSFMQIHDPESMQKYLELAIQARTEQREYPFIVFDKIKNKYAGSTRFYDIQKSFQTTQLGYTWYGKEFQGTYLNKNCKYLLLEFAFETLLAERVEFRADARNERSKQAMLSIGCTLEGTLRNHLPTTDGGRRNSIVLSILQQEWHQGVKEALAKKII
jgi:RimJ/RimL family protein N-acetyltransferase